MRTKLIVIALAVSAIGFAAAPRSNAGTEVVEPQYAPQQTYNYAPPPRPVYYAPPPPVNVLIFPAYGYYGPRFGVHRFYGRHVYWRPDHHWR